MHELSIAKSLLSLTREHVPAGSVVRAVRVRVGPLQAIDPSAMQLAWRAATDDTSYRGAALSLNFVPWELSCRGCGNRWFTQSWPARCRCGGHESDPIDADELTLESIDVMGERLRVPARPTALQPVAEGD